jgi:hypothetical protein
MVRVYSVFSKVPLTLILPVLAFCNTHDVSWGTKGQDKVATDLGVVKSGKGGDKASADVAVTDDAQDLNAEYDDASKSCLLLRGRWSTR